MSGNEVGGGAIPAPPGIVPNLINPQDHTRDFIILHTFCLTFVTTAIGIRLYTRALITRKVGMDDYMSLFAWVLTVSFSGLLLAATKYGIGRHIWDVPATWLIPGLKLLYVTEIMYIPITLSVKLAFLLFFDRVFAVQTRTKWLTRGAMVANFIFYTITWFKSIFLCIPVERNYNPGVPGHCGAEDVLPYLTGVWAFLSDIYILILPIHCVWMLNVKTKRRLKLILTFSVGLFACIASIIRFAYTVELIDDYDVTWNFAKLSLWSVLEVDVGLLCACLPAFPAFIDHYFPEDFSFRSLFSPFTSYFSASRVSKGTPQFTPSQSRKGIVHDEDGVAEGNYIPLEEGIPAKYNDINDRAPLATEMRSDDDQLGRGQFVRTTSKREFPETLVPANEMRYVARGDTERDLAMQTLER